MKKKILILSTGGTIACSETEQGLLPTATAEALMTHSSRLCALTKLSEDLWSTPSIIPTPSFLLPLITKAAD